MVLEALAVFAVVFVAAWWSTRRSWDKEPTLEPTSPVLDLTAYAARRRHPRLEFEIHAHRHWGLKRRRFSHGQFPGWSFHLGFGIGCLCIDYLRRGRRP